MPVVDPCKKFACNIQVCLQANHYKESACSAVFQQMKQCCEQWRDKSESCAGFIKEKKTRDSYFQEMTSRKLFAAAADRNKDPILKILLKYCPPTVETVKCLEIASGSGQHVVHFGMHMPHVEFQPSDCDPDNLNSIQDYVSEADLINVQPPLSIDILSDISQWNLPHQQYDLMVNINMIHISPWQCSVSLFEKASKLLKPKALLVTYGPYAIHGLISPESNVNFHQSLLQRNPLWGLRDIDDLQRMAAEHHITLQAVEDMPSNNKMLLWRKQ